MEEIGHKQLEFTFLPIDQAISEDISRELFEKEFSHLKKELESQRTLSHGIIIGVGLAFVLSLGMMILELALFHHKIS